MLTRFMFCKKRRELSPSAKDCEIIFSRCEFFLKQKEGL